MMNVSGRPAEREVLIAKKDGYVIRHCRRDEEQAQGFRQVGGAGLCLIFGGELVGKIGAYEVRPALEIYAIEILPSQQKKGHGTRAIELLKEYWKSRGGKYVIAVGVLADRYSWWEKLGFTREEHGDEVHYKLSLQ